MENSRQNFFSWYFSKGLPSYTKSQVKNISQAAYFFNFIGLIQNLFAPYRRLTSVPTTGNKLNRVFDQLSFNILSRTIGLAIRTLLIIGGFILFVLVTLYFLASIPVYAILLPLMLPKYLKYRNKYVHPADLSSKENFEKKLRKNTLYQKVSLFFDHQFQLIFDKIELQTFNIQVGETIGEILNTLCKNSQRLQIYLERNEIKPAEFEILLKTIKDLIEQPPRSKLIPLGETLAFGYTNTLDRYSIELTRQNQPTAHTNFELLSQAERILTRPQDNNVLLVGEPGVGRHTTLNMLASAIQNNQIPSLNNRRLMLLDTVAIASGHRNLVDTKNTLQIIIDEAARAGNIILAIDSIDKITSTKEGHIDLSEALTQHLKSDVPLIGITSLDDYNEFVRPNTALLKLFEKIDVPEASYNQTLSILIEKALEEYKKEGVQTYLSAIVEIIRQSEKLLTERKQPEKSIIFFNDIIGDANQNKLLVIDPKQVEKVLSSFTPIPVGKIGKRESKTLQNLEDLLHQRIVGQDEAIVEISKSLRRARAGIGETNRPTGSFLFLGPTGVGKTETAKVLARTYFGDENNMVRLDMSEFQDDDALKKLTGDASSKTPGILTSQIRNHPFSILLLDEFEKANVSAHNLFLQILDEGFVTDALGKKVSFSNNIIIATSNAGAEFIREQLGVQPPKDLSKSVIEFVLQKGFLSPELVNRFDATIVYRPLTMDEIIKVTTLMLKDLAKKLKETKNITLEITEELAQKAATAGYDPQFGARPIRRYIQDHIEDQIARMVISGNLKNGDNIKAARLFQNL